MDIKNSAIGFFDSGVGGLSVMREAISIMPNENFIYFGDSKNAPYGIKSFEEIRRLSLNAADFLIKKNIKALVVACNTATSVAIKDLREKYKDIPIIGIEPAIKPAVEQKKQGKIIIMATPMTLAEKKFNRLINKYIGQAEFVSVPCPELVELVESGKLEGKEVSDYLKEKLNPYLKNDVGAIVLGCTHFPFVKKEIQLLAEDASIIDGSFGTVKQLKRKLGLNNMLNEHNNVGKVELYNSLENSEIIELSYKLLGL